MKKIAWVIYMLIGLFLTGALPALAYSRTPPDALFDSDQTFTFFVTNNSDQTIQSLEATIPGIDEGNGIGMPACLGFGTLSPGQSVVFDTKFLTEGSYGGNITLDLYRSPTCTFPPTGITNDNAIDSWQIIYPAQEVPLLLTVASGGNATAIYATKGLYTLILGILPIFIGLLTLLFIVLSIAYFYKKTQNLKL